MLRRPRRLALLLACAAGACAPSAPAAFAGQHGAGGQGVVLSLASHGAQLVARDHRVATVHLVSKRELQPGDVVSVRDGRARVTGHQRKLSFLAHVVRTSARGALLALDDGSSFKLLGGQRRRGHGARSARSAAGAARALQDLAAGDDVLVTIALDQRGGAVSTVKVLRRASGGGDERGTPDPGDESDCGPDEYVDEDGWCVSDEAPGNEVDGTVTAVADDASSLTVAPDDGGAATTIPVSDADLLEGIEVGDDVAVTLDETGTAIDVELIDWVDDPGDGDGDEGDE